MTKDIFKLGLIYLATTIIFYGYYVYFGSGRMNTVYKNWDGPSYVIAAKSLYVPRIATENNMINSKDIRVDWTFLPAHFPLVPLLIRSLSGIGYFQAMIVVTIVSSMAAIVAFYHLIKSHQLVKDPLLLAIPLIFLSPRWFIVSHVGGSEPLFLFFLIMFVNAFLSHRHKGAAVWAALAQVTRPQGALIAVAVLVIALLELKKSGKIKKIVSTYYPYLLIPLALLSVFSFFYFQTGDFWAFFSAISIFNHTSLIPFSTFSYASANIETFWQEVNALDYVIYLAAIMTLLKQKLTPLAVLGLIFFAPLPFLHHSDISRYAIPLLPLAFIAYRDIIATKEFALATLLMSPAIMSYAINFMEFNHGS